MKAGIPAMAIALVLLAGAAQAAPAPMDAPPSPPLPTLEISTMLFLMLGQNDAYANTAEPIDINAFDIDFGDEAGETSAAIDAVLQGK